MIKLINDDCLNAMKDIPDSSIDMILCDLPYGTTACKWDNIIPFDQLWEQYNKIIKDNGAICLFGNEPFSSKLRMSNLKYYKYDWVWEKPKGSGFLLAKKKPLKNYEIISVFYKKPPLYNPQFREGKPYKTKQGYIGEYFYTKNPKQTETKNNGTRYPVSILKFNMSTGLHPTQKPVELLEYLIKTYTNENELVLDNCMGSGSTGVACVKTNRNFLGIEINKNFYDIAKERIENVKKEIENE